MVAIPQCFQKLRFIHAGQSLQGINHQPMQVPVASAALIGLAMVAFVEGLEQPIELGAHSGKADFRIDSACIFDIVPCQRGILS